MGGLMWWLGIGTLWAGVERVLVQDERPTPTDVAADLLQLSWPFCPTNRIPCSTSNPPVWVQMDVSVDTYSERVRDPHDSVQALTVLSRQDFQPIAEGLQRYLKRRGLEDEVSAAGHAQGMIQAILYAYDTTTGWTEYPKFALEFIVDEQGDCDDAALATGALLADLGLEAWLIRWRPIDPNERVGHLSTAVSMTGALKDHPLPKGSRLVTAPGGQSLLHVDGVGSSSGCASGCSELGWNRWHSAPVPLKEVSVVQYDDPDIDSKLPLSAWNHDKYGFTRPPDREIAPPDVTDDVLKERLVKIRARQEEHTEARLALIYAHERDVLYYTWSAVAGSMLLVGLGGAWVQRRRRREQIRKQAENRERRLF